MSLITNPSRNLSREELRDFLNAEHGKNDLTPEEVKTILEYDIYKLQSDLNKESMSVQQIDPQEIEAFIDQSFAALPQVINSHKVKISEMYKDNPLMVNQSIVNEAKEIYGFFAQKNFYGKFMHHFEIDGVGLSLNLNIDDCIEFDQSDLVKLRMICKKYCLIVEELAGTDHIEVVVNFGIYAKPLHKQEVN